MNLLITGGAGFIGSHLTRRMVLKYPQYRIINFDLLTYAGNLESLKDVEGRANYVFVKGDIRDKQVVAPVFEKYDVDSVVHLAAESHVDRSIMDPGEFLTTNILGTHTLLEAAMRQWEKTRKTVRRIFLNVSTDEVYGSIENGSFTEDSTYAPNSPYAASKAGADHIVRAYHKTYGLPTAVTHSSNNYGPYQFPEKLIPVVVLNALEGKPLPVYGEGKNVRDWLHVEDHAAALDTALHKAEPGSTYNIGTHNEWKNIDLIRLICSLLDLLAPRSPFRPHSSLIKFVKDRPGHDLRYSIDSSKIQRELGWKPAHDFEKGIRSTVKWYLDNPEWTKSVRDGRYKG